MSAIRFSSTHEIYDPLAIYTLLMAKHLVDIDERVLQAARTRLGTETIKATVNQALRQVGGDRDASVRDSLDVLARMELAPREQAWR